MFDLNPKLAVLVFFMLFCASGGLGVVIQELHPGAYPVALGVRVGRAVEVCCSMFFYWIGLYGLIKIKESAQGGMVNEQSFVSGVYLFVCGLTGHSLLYLLFN